MTEVHQLTANLSQDVAHHVMQTAEEIYPIVEPADRREAFMHLKTHKNNEGRYVFEHGDLNLEVCKEDPTHDVLVYGLPSVDVRFTCEHGIEFYASRHTTKLDDVLLEVLNKGLKK